jgi:hypothetical protein
MNMPPVAMIIGFLNAHNLNTAEVEDSEYLDNLLSNVEEMIVFEGGEEWRSGMAKEYQKYFFKKKLESIK